MRVLLIVLLLVNVLLFSWFQFQAAEKKVVNTKKETVIKSLPQIRLKDEVPLFNVIDSTEKPQELVDNDNSMCELIGPYQDNITAQAQAILLAESGITARLIERVDEIVPLYWVYIPPFDSREQAISKLESLQIAGVDSYLVTEDEWENAISLGFFRTLQAAESVVKELSLTGNNVAKTIRQREIKSTWLAIEGNDVPKISKAVFQTLKKDNLLLKKEEKGCNSVALLPSIY